MAGGMGRAQDDREALCTVTTALLSSSLLIATRRSVPVAMGWAGLCQHRHGFLSQEHCEP